MGLYPKTKQNKNPFKWKINFPYRIYMTRILENNEVCDYISQSPARDHIMFYLRQGFSIDKSIRKGLEEHLQELMDMLAHQERYIEHLEGELYHNLDERLYHYEDETDSEDFDF